jgi:membrane protein DedA with SNARE-associated domain
VLWIALALVGGTFVSEDATSVLAGVLIQRGEIDAIVGVAACAVGIFLGDLGLWLVGRHVGARALSWRFVTRHLTDTRTAHVAAWFERHTASLVLGSRFVPGARLPLYLAAGAVQSSFRRFALWSLLAVAIWTPIIVFASAGALAVSGFLISRPTDTAGTILLAGGLVLAWRVATRLTRKRGRQQLAAHISRVWRWEFWPMWLFYAPVAAWLLWLVTRHRGIGPIRAANPGIEDGGIVGESKHEILAHLPDEWTIPSIRIDGSQPEPRVWQFASAIASRSWTFPLVLKPDVGQRGVGVRIARTLEEARDYLTHTRGAVVVQPYHPGPFEAGVFYYRLPGEARGHILSITDKDFPFAVGDGISTLEDLIWADKRLRMQARTFLARHADASTRVLARGERLRLAIAGNHAQGTLFRDGRHLITPALEERMDQIAHTYHGFFIGRFDIRYGDVDRFKAGDDLAIVELNGATAESTNIYDPSGSLIGAYRQLFRQWSLVFALGAANMRRGAPAMSLTRLFDLLRAHWAADVAFKVSD